MGAPSLRVFCARVGFHGTVRQGFCTCTCHLHLILHLILILNLLSLLHFAFAFGWRAGVEWFTAAICPILIDGFSR